MRTHARTRTESLKAKLGIRDASSRTFLTSTKIQQLDSTHTK